MEWLSMTLINREKIIEYIADCGFEEEDIILYDGFENAFIGLASKFHSISAVYDYDKSLDILINRDGMSPEEADEYMQFNVVGAWLGDSTPVFIFNKFKP